MHFALVCFHKYFALTGGLKSGKCESLWSSAEHTAEAVTCQGKYIYPTAKIVKSLHNYVRIQWKRFWVCIYAHCSSMRSQTLYPNRRIEIWEVRMFVKQRRTQSWSIYLPGKKYIYPQGKIVKSLHHYVRSQWKRFWVHIYAHCSNMRSQMLYTRGSFEICQERMFVKQRGKHSWSSYSLVALTELRKNVITYIVPRNNTQNFIFAKKFQKKLGLHKKTRQNFTCTWPEHSAIVSSLTLKCNASAVVVVAEKMWISQNMLWLPCSGRMSRF